MKKIKGFILILVLAILSSSCVKNDIKMTDEQIDRAAEYAAGVLLKYDRNYESTLISETVIPEGTTEPVSTNEVTATENPETSNKIDTDSTNKDSKKEQLELTDVINVKECKINFSKYQILNSYEQGKSVYIKADKGKKLVVLEFKIKNKSDSDRKVKLLKKNITYTLIVNNGGEYQPNLSILVNDLQFYNENIQKGKSKKAVLVFNVPKQEIKNTMKLQVIRDNQISEVKVK